MASAAPPQRRARRGRAGRGRPRAIPFYCWFCGSRLVSGRGADGRRCGGCGAQFVLQRNARACVVALQVASCGAPDCCGVR